MGIPDIKFSTLPLQVFVQTLNERSDGETLSASVHSELGTVYHLVVATPNIKGVLEPLTFSAYSTIDGINTPNTPHAPPTYTALEIIEDLNISLANHSNLGEQPFYLGKYDPAAEPGGIPGFVFCAPDDESCLSEYPDIIVSMVSFTSEILALAAIEQIDKHLCR